MLLEVLEAANRIESGESLAIAGDASVMSQLPKGRWIGGSIPYFMGERGTTTRQLVFATSLPGSPEEVVIKEYDASGLSVSTPMHLTMAIP